MLRSSASSLSPSLLLTNEHSTNQFTYRSVYKSCQFVANICLHADSNANKPMAVRAAVSLRPTSFSPSSPQIIFPHEVNLRRHVSEKAIPVGEHPELKDLCSNEAVNKAVLAELGMVAKKAGLKGLETLQCIILTPDEWTPQNGLLTAGASLLPLDPCIGKLTLDGLGEL